MIPRLKEFGVLEVWVRHRSLEFLEDLIDAELGERQREVYCHVRRNFEAVMQDSVVDLDVERMQTSIVDLFAFLKQSRCGDVLLQKLDAFDNYLMSHSTNVCYLSLILGLKLERYLIEQRSLKTAQEAKDLKELGLGCLLHDVGKMRIPREILDKPGKLTDEELEVMKRHPVYGYKMVRGRAPTAACQVVLNHHQRYCGGGYPERVDRLTNEPLPSLSGQQIPIFCRIATVCDVYDAATTKRVYSDAKPAAQALHEMRTWCQGFFDPVIERAFYEIVPAFPIGQQVTLSNGATAVVVDFNPQFPERPKVQCLRLPGGEHVTDPSLEEIDLAIYPDVEIAAVQCSDGMKDVTPYLNHDANSMAACC